MNARQERLAGRVQVSQFIAIFSVVFALAGFSYNVWRMEVTETNNNIRTACFEMLTELAELEQLIYAASYDQDPQEGNPRRGWVKVRLVLDLSAISTDGVKHKAENLQAVWGELFSTMAKDTGDAETIVSAIDELRTQIAGDLRQLR